jgi:hypothetical protein
MQSFELWKLLIQHGDLPQHSGRRLLELRTMLRLHPCVLSHGRRQILELPFHVPRHGTI